MSRKLLLSFILLFFTSILRADNVSEEFKLFRGNWQITELVEDGRVIAPNAIKDMFPSGGRVEIVDNTIFFISRLDGQKRTKTLSIDPSAYPKGIAVSTRDKVEGLGIYQFDNGRLVMCVSDPAVAQRPTDFSARNGSQRMLMTLERDDEPLEGQGETSPFASNLALSVPPTTNSTPPAKTSQPPVPPLPTPPQSAPPQPAPSQSAATAKVLTDAEVLVMLRGTWKFNDGQGVLVVTMKPDGTYFSTREVLGAQTFHQVFTATPVSNGTWSVSNGQLTFQIAASIYSDRVNRAVPLSIRSISQSDLIFVDYLGRMGRAEKVQ